MLSKAVIAPSLLPTIAPFAAVIEAKEPEPVCFCKILEYYFTSFDEVKCVLDIIKILFEELLGVIVT